MQVEQCNRAYQILVIQAAGEHGNCSVKQAGESILLLVLVNGGRGRKVI